MSVRIGATAAASATALSVVCGHAVVAYKADGGGVGVRSDAGREANVTGGFPTDDATPAAADVVNTAETCRDGIGSGLVAGDVGRTSGDDIASGG